MSEPLIVETAIRLVGQQGADALSVRRLGLALGATALALPSAAFAADQGVWRETYLRLDADTHPDIAAAAPLLARDMSHSAFPFALDLFLDALAARLRA